MEWSCVYAHRVWHMAKQSDCSLNEIKKSHQRSFDVSIKDCSALLQSNLTKQTSCDNVWWTYATDKIFISFSSNDKNFFMEK